MMARDVYWHLPGLCSLRVLNHIMISLMREEPGKFREGYKIGSVYGTFPGAIWNGGRAVFGLTGREDILKILDVYNKNGGVPVRFTWTNSLLEEKHKFDTYCNLIMRLADNGLNQVLVNTPCLEEYIRREYPSYRIISSTTKRITGVEGVLEELEKDYFLVVLDYDLNHDEGALKALEPHADRVEILVNEVCYPGCKMRKEHYEQQSLAQLEWDIRAVFPCPNKTTQRKFEECRKRPAFISNEQIGEYIDRGFVNFKIVGRGMPMEYAKDSCLYFLVKDEYREEIRKKVDERIAQYSSAQQARR